VAFYFVIVLFFLPVPHVFRYCQRPLQLFMAKCCRCEVLDDVESSLSPVPALLAGFPLLPNCLTVQASAPQIQVAVAPPTVVEVWVLKTAEVMTTTFRVLLPILSDCVLLFNEG
jgi:hypothetical protein